MTNITPEAVAELDKLRTQGEWHNTGGNIWIADAYWNGSGEPEQFQNLLATSNEIDGNFIAAAPAMAALISQQDKRIRELEKMYFSSTFDEAGLCIRLEQIQKILGIEFDESGEPNSYDNIIPRLETLIHGVTGPISESKILTRMEIRE